MNFIKNKPAIFMAIIVMSGSSILSGCSYVDRTASNHQIIKPRPEGPFIGSQFECSNRFSLLQKMHSKQFSVYRDKFDKLNEYYGFYQQNKQLMNSDSKELMSFRLNSKLKFVCAKADNDTLSEVFTMMDSIADI